MTLLRKGKFARKYPTESGGTYNLFARFIKRRKEEVLDSMIFFMAPQAPSRQLIAPAKLKAVIADARQRNDALLVNNIEQSWINLCRMLDNKPFFDICPIDQIIKYAQVQFTAETHPVYANLYVMHCRDYKDMRAEVMHSLPEHINLIFSEGLSKKDAAAV